MITRAQRRIERRRRARRNDFRRRGGGFLERGAGYGGFGAVGGGMADIDDDFTDFDLWTPEQQSFPASVAEVTALGWSSNIEGAWGFQESGITFADFSGNGLTLTSTNTSKTLSGQVAVGLNDGSSFTAQRAFEIVDGGTNADRASLADTAALDLDGTTARSIVLMFRVSTPPSATVAMGGKQGATGYANISMNTSGHVLFTVYDGTTAVSATSGANHADGAWHYALIRIDPTADTIQVITDLTTGAAASTAAINWTLVSNTGPFSIGATTLSNGAAAQYRGLIVLGDVATTPAAVAAWWRHGRAPSRLTYSRASQFSSVVAVDDTGDVVSTWGNGQVTYEYNSLISTNSRKLGLSSYTAVTNLLARTNLNHADWLVVNATKTSYADDSPRGFREAVTVTKTAANGRLRYSSFAVSATTTYTVSCWVKWDGTNTQPVLVATGVTSGVTHLSGGSTIVGDGTWQRITGTFTSTVAEQVLWDLYPSGTGTAAGTCQAWGPMANAGEYAQPWVFTNGATAATVAIAASASAPGLRTPRGTLKFWSICAGQGIPSGSRFVGAAVNADSNRAYAREMQINSSEAQSAQVFDSAGASGASASIGVIADLATAEGVTTMWWDQAETNGWSLKTRRNSTEGQTSVDLPVDDAEISVICIGRAFATGSLQLDGAISKIRVWNRVELAA